MRAIDRTRYGAPARRLIEDALVGGRPATLSFGEPVATARAALAAMDETALGGGRKARDGAAVALLRAGLWLLHDFMDEAHVVAQDIETPAGNYWHALVHRREPDAANSGYWFARVGNHSIFDELCADASELAGTNPGKQLAAAMSGGAWHARRFVDLCATDPAGTLRERLLAIQRREWELLFDFDWRHAFVGQAGGPR